ncbi:FAD-binding oxidoreductase [Anaerolineae bacterium CFX7]|nr:FAD-binding oxidoreductase [Anaerolineae bacterium CFX7]
MKQLCEVVIIGAGIVGAATAFALTRAGNLRVALLEKGPLAGGMTRRSAGVAHPFQSHPRLIQYALESIAFYQNAAQHLGPSKNEFITTGAALVGGNADAAKMFAQAQALARFTQDASALARGALAAQFPGVAPQLQAGLFTPHAGYADAAQMTQRLIQAAQTRGLTVATGAHVKQIQTVSGGARSVTTTMGSFEAPIVIVAAGGWSDKVLASASQTVTLQFQRGAVLFYEQPPEMTASHPIFWDVHGEFFLRPHPYRLSAAGWIAPPTPALTLEPFDEFVAPPAATRVSQFMEQCLASKFVAPKRSHTIVYATGADGLPLMGRVHDAAGLFIAAGFGANTFAVAPAVGKILAQLIVDGNAPPAASFFATPYAKEETLC